MIILYCKDDLSTNKNVKRIMGKQSCSECIVVLLSFSLSINASHRNIIFLTKRIIGIYS